MTVTRKSLVLVLSNVQNDTSENINGSMISSTCINNSNTGCNPTFTEKGVESL